MLEIAKLLGMLVAGGLAGAFVTEWFRRRRSKVQPIPLIERVNRIVNPALQGFTLARVVGNSTSYQLEEVKDLREYQLTMRNASSIHLRDAEVQFEFPADDVQAWASRPTLSKTPLEPVDVKATEPWKKAFRWRIPHLPSGDSVEFTFQAVGPSSEKYEAALYNCDGVIFESVVGEPAPKKRVGSAIFSIAFAGLVITGLLIALFLAGHLISPSGEKFVTIKLAGCDLIVDSFYDTYTQSFNSPWRIKQRIFNSGSQDCVIKSEKINVANPATIKAGEVLEKERLTQSAPTLLDVEISVGATSGSLSTTNIPLYVPR